MSQVQMTVSDSLAACGFNVYDMQDMREVVSAGAELTVDNLAEMEPLQATFARLMSKLPTTSVLDEDGNETFKVDSTSDAFKDFMAAAKDMALDRLCYATQYTKTFARSRRSLARWRGWTSALSAMRTVTWWTSTPRCSGTTPRLVCCAIRVTVSRLTILTCWIRS